MQAELDVILCSLIKEYMALPDNYGVDKDGNEIPCIIIKGQNIKLHNTPHLQITVGIINSNIYANNTEFINNGTLEKPDYAESVCMNEQATVQIDVYSANNEARTRYKEVQACLTSYLAQQYQEKYQFRLSQISDATNTTGLDGASYLNRYTIRFNALTWFNKITQISYYDKFSMEAYNEEGKFFESSIQD